MLRRTHAPHGSSLTGIPSRPEPTNTVRAQPTPLTGDQSGFHEASIPFVRADLLMKGPIEQLTSPRAVPESHAAIGLACSALARPAESDCCKPVAMLTDPPIFNTSDRIDLGERVEVIEPNDEPSPTFISGRQRVYHHLTLKWDMPQRHVC